MHTARRAATATACLLLAALVFTGCGVDAGDQTTSGSTGSSSSSGSSDSSTTAPSKDLSPIEEEAVDRAKDLYVDMGMDPDDAECLARGLVDAGAVEGTVDPSDTSAMMDIVNQCDIDMGDLSSLGSENGISSMEDGVKFGLESSLKAAGLTDVQAECVAAAFVDEFGTDMSAMQDMDQITPLLEGCDVDPSTLGG